MAKKIPQPKRVDKPEDALKWARVNSAVFKRFKITCLASGVDMIAGADEALELWCDKNIQNLEKFK